MCGLTFELTPTAEAGRLARAVQHKPARRAGKLACRSGSGAERGVRPHFAQEEGVFDSRGEPVLLYLLATTGAVAVPRVCGERQGSCRALRALQPSVRILFLGMVHWSVGPNVREPAELPTVVLVADFDTDEMS